VTIFSESVVEQAALVWLEAIGWRVARGPDIAPDMPAAERRDYGEVVLAQRLRDAVARLNPTLPAEAVVLLGRRRPAQPLDRGRQDDGTDVQEMKQRLGRLEAEYDELRQGHSKGSHEPIGFR
jgi:hypothetical protein